MSAQEHPVWLGMVVPYRTHEAARMYWETDIPAAEIAATYKPGWNVNKFVMQDVGCAATAFVCEACDGPVTVESRTAAYEVYNPYLGKRRSRRYQRDIICSGCRTKIRESRSVNVRERWEKRRKRKDELRYMPYREYLQTPEWRSTRTAAMKRAGFKCQTCSEGGLLHVHHRTYVRRGDERASDLIVLCAACHELFHQKRQLAEGGRAA